MTRKLKAQDRRPAIAQAAIPVFARHGFAGATTKKLAEAAGVSEALLSKDLHHWGNEGPQAGVSGPFERSVGLYGCGMTPSAILGHSGPQ